MRTDKIVRASNNPDIALAQEWFAELDEWIGAHGLCGYDPFDVKQHPLIRAAQPRPLLRKATTALCDLFPYAGRRLLRIPPTENPKAHALVATACLRIHEWLGDEAYRDTALEHLAWLDAHATEGYSGACWGYPFEIHAKGLVTPKHTPILVVSAIAGDAYLRAHRLIRKQAYLDRARAIAEFILQDLPRMEAEDDTYCFAYAPCDTRRVHNANLLAVEHLVRMWAVTHEDALLDAALPALRFTLERQREDGAWPYGESAPEDPFEPGLLALVDHHHTGFVLRSLHGIAEAREDEEVTAALRKGFRYYRNLFTSAGMPIHEYGLYPVDIHACAEAVLCTSMLSRRLSGAKKLAVASLRWSHEHMWDRERRVLAYRKYPLFTSRITFPRWGIAWMYRALAEYLIHFAETL